LSEPPVVYRGWQLAPPHPTAGSSIRGLGVGTRDAEGLVMAKPTKPPALARPAAPSSRMTGREREALETIDLGALSTVTGGRTSATAAAQSTSTGTSSTAGGDANSQLMTLLTQIVTSLQDMNQQRQQDPFMRAVMLMQAIHGMNGNGTGGNGGFGL